MQGVEKAYELRVKQARQLKNKSHREDDYQAICNSYRAIRRCLAAMKEMRISNGGQIWHVCPREDLPRLESKDIAEICSLVGLKYVPKSTPVNEEGNVEDEEDATENKKGGKRKNKKQKQKYEEEEQEEEEEAQEDEQPKRSKRHTSDKEETTKRAINSNKNDHERGRGRTHEHQQDRGATRSRSRGNTTQASSAEFLKSMLSSAKPNIAAAVASSGGTKNYTTTLSPVIIPARKQQSASSAGSGGIVTSFGRKSNPPPRIVPWPEHTEHSDSSSKGGSSETQAAPGKTQASNNNNKVRDLPPAAPRTKRARKNPTENDQVAASQPTFVMLTPGSVSHVLTVPMGPYSLSDIDDALAHTKHVLQRRLSAMPKGAYYNFATQVDLAFVDFRTAQDRAMPNSAEQHLLASD